MEINIPEGISLDREYTVTDNDTAISLGSGEVRVLATPRLLAMMEEVSYKSVASLLPEGCVSVGTEMKVSHLRASAVGETILCHSVLTKSDGRALEFTVTADDSHGRIGEGRCCRFVVVKERFEEKALAALNNR